MYDFVIRQVYYLCLGVVALVATAMLVFLIAWSAANALTALIVGVVAAVAWWIGFVFTQFVESR